MSIIMEQTGGDPARFVDYPLATGQPITGFKPGT
jgi:hypothetical protein